MPSQATGHGLSLDPCVITPGGSYNAPATQVTSTIDLTLSSLRRVFLEPQLSDWGSSPP
jgi:hypothetical protein